MYLDDYKLESYGVWQVKLIVHDKMKNRYKILSILKLNLTNMKLTKKEIELYKNTAKKLKKSQQRKFKAEITNMYFEWNTLKARRVLWWFSETIELW